MDGWKRHGMGECMEEWVGGGMGGREGTGMMEEMDGRSKEWVSGEMGGREGTGMI